MLNIIIMFNDRCRLVITIISIKIRIILRLFIIKARPVLVMGMEFYGDDFNGADVAPFVGINTFLHLPLVKNHKELVEANPDVAIIGEPFDFGTTIRPGARYGPRAIRAASTVPSPPFERFNIETGADPFGTFRTVDYGDVIV